VVNLDLLGQIVDPVGHLLRCGATVVTVELDSEIIIGSTGVMRRSEQDSTVCLSRSDHGGCGGSGENGILSDDEGRDTVSGGDPDDLLDGFGGL
jgi:hypothetical protein